MIFGKPSIDISTIVCIASSSHAKVYFTQQRDCVLSIFSYEPVFLWFVSFLYLFQLWHVTKTFIHLSFWNVVHIK